MIPLSVAEIVVEPAARALARPVEEMVAAEAFVELQLTDTVKLWVELSEYVPVAVNWTEPPAVKDEFAGVTAMELSTAAVTVREVLPEIVPSVAVMVVLPVATAAAKPEELMVAAAVLVEAQVTLVVMFFVELSE